MRRVTVAGVRNHTAALCLFNTGDHWRSRRASWVFSLKTRHGCAHMLCVKWWMDCTSADRMRGRTAVFGLHLCVSVWAIKCWSWCSTIWGVSWRTVVCVCACVQENFLRKTFPPYFLFSLKTLTGVCDAQWYTHTHTRDMTLAWWLLAEASSTTLLTFDLSPLSDQNSITSQLHPTNGFLYDN